MSATCLCIFFSFVLSSSYAVSGNKTILFISGWPQSGTSLLQQILTVDSGVSTMVNNCVAKHGRKCVNINNEGQWLIGDASATRYYAPGEMCPWEIKEQLSTEKFIREKWETYWETNKSVLVEKSPAGMMKIPLLRHIFSAPGVVLKFLIIMKHPASLNIASVKKRGWLSHYIEDGEEVLTSQIIGGRDGDRPATLNTKEQSIANVAHFIEMMTHRWSGNQVTLNDTTARPNTPHPLKLQHCSLGWLPAFEHITSELSNVSDIATSDVRIVRYEDLEQPYMICASIFQFVYSINSKTSLVTTPREPNIELYKSALVEVCGKHFFNPYLSRKQRLERLGHVRQFRQLRLQGGESGSSATTMTKRGPIRDAGGQLRRVKTRTATKPAGVSYTSLHFQPERISKALYQRLHDFKELFDSLSDGSKEKKTLIEINERLIKFGYNIHYKNRGTEAVNEVLHPLDKFNIKYYTAPIQ